MANSLYSMNDVFRETLKSVSKDSDSPVSCDDLAVARASIVLGSAQVNLGMIEQAEHADGIAIYSEEQLAQARSNCIEGCRAVYSAVGSFNTIADHYGNHRLGPGLDLSRTPDEVADVMKAYFDAKPGRPNYMAEADTRFAQNLLIFTKAAGDSILPKKEQDKTEGKTLRERIGAQFDFGSSVTVGDGEREARSIVD